MNTGIVLELERKLGCKLIKEPIIVSEYKYVYKLKSNGESFVLKGYKLILAPLDQSEAKSIYEEAIQKLSRIYQEFYLAKIIYVMSSNFVKPLQIASTVLLPIEASIAVEMLFEDGGDSLKACFPLFKMPIELAFNWMRQSASALAVLNDIGVSHLDVKPENMIYNKTKKLLKIIDLGSASVYADGMLMNNLTKTISTKITECTLNYSPPEILQSIFCTGTSTNPVSYVIGSVDSYCWAMSFYALLLNKNDLQLNSEFKKYKLQTASIYKQFIESMKNDINKMKNNKNAKEIELITFISDILEVALQFDPVKRPKMMDILNALVKFEKSASIGEEYAKQEKESQKKYFKIFGISVDEYEHEIQTLKKQKKEIEEKIIIFQNEKVKALEDSQKFKHRIELIKSLSEKDAANNKLLLEKLQKENDLKLQAITLNLEQSKKIFEKKLNLLQNQNNEASSTFMNELQKKESIIINLEKEQKKQNLLFKEEEEKNRKKFENVIEKLKKENYLLQAEVCKYKSLVLNTKEEENKIQNSKFIPLAFHKAHPEDDFTFLLTSANSTFSFKKVINCLKSYKIYFSDLVQINRDMPDKKPYVKGIVHGQESALELYWLNNKKVEKMIIVTRIILINMEKSYNRSVSRNNESLPEHKKADSYYESNNGEDENVNSSKSKAEDSYYRSSHWDADLDYEDYDQNRSIDSYHSNYLSESYY